MTNQNKLIQSFRGANKVEHDSCGIVSFVEKENIPTKENIDNTIQALVKMNHRAGFINEEGDGVGIHIDVPKTLWKKKLEAAAVPASNVDAETFTVGHFFIDRASDVSKAQEEVRQKIVAKGLNVIFESTEETNREALGPIAKKSEPVFWQVALIGEELAADQSLASTLFELTVEIEENTDIHVASLSHDHAVYKVMGAGDILPRYYNDLADPLVASTATLGHNRYSTNTLSNFFRVQPFSVIGHNGEINTIAKLRDEANMLGVPLVDGGSDSQDLNRVLDTFISRHGLSLFEAMEVLFPPIVNEIKHYPAHLKDLYTYIREAWGHFAQGPAGIISRYGKEAVFSVDALGLRPVWMLETETSYSFSSEQGIFTSDNYLAEPKPLAPGEKVGLYRNEDTGTIEVYWHDELQEEVYGRMSNRVSIENAGERLSTKLVPTAKSIQFQQTVNPSVYSANGWDREHIQLIEQMAEKGVEPIRSLGHDAPLAALHPTRKNIADFIKESVAVVTNPAIDRDREMEHFSTRVIIGKRPALFNKEDLSTVIQLESPVIAEGLAGKTIEDNDGQPSYESLLALYKEAEEAQILPMVRYENESVEEALERLNTEASEAIDNGKSFLVFDDHGTHTDNKYWIDPLLAISSVDQGLTKEEKRRAASFVLRSGSIRTLHDIAVVFGLGADIVHPYVMFSTVVDGDGEPASKLYGALNKGLEKVISTIGIHELRGYGRLFSSIGLNDDIANVLNIVNFLGGKDLSYNFEQMKEDSIARKEDYTNEKARPGKTFHIFPRLWKALGDLASGRSGYEEYREKLAEQEVKNPISIRHLADLKKVDSDLKADDVDVSVKNHSLPFMISSMSFGSQNETAFRAYAEAADRLNMISFNGEGGEIKDMLGKYPNTRGQQIASGRFGVNVELLNSSNLLEIKIGQGAKPGEGGHLPGSKVTEKVAAARNATTGSDLISPSNNHDIYSIEDLAQMITEIKTANDKAKVAVKVPIVPNIGTIAVGIAKAGADYITLSGFDGGTGAARVHALQHVGLPAEIGVKAAHFALLEAGLRHKVEIWADGGVKSALDALKLMLLGANRIGFGTLAMIAVGCTACRGCHLDTCHVGIATQIESEAQAKEHGLRRFVPREFDLAVQGLTNLFGAFGKELQALTASLGVKRTQDLVGRADLLEQIQGKDLMDLTELLSTLPEQDVTNIETAEVVAEEETQLAVAVGAEHYLDSNVAELTSSREFEAITAEQRVIGSRVAGHRVRGKLDGSYRQLPEIDLRYTKGSILGNGLGAYNSDGVNIYIDGGAQDGVGKTSFGGSFKILKSKGRTGQFVNGSVGKGAGYGAQKGLFIIQGNADARAGIRLSGADMIFGGRLTKPLVPGRRHNIGVHANLKGFAFEYMTNGRGLVLGDPGPWICAGMTGGVVYLRYDEKMGLDEKALKSRIAKGAKVALESLSEQGLADVVELLTLYKEELVKQGQVEEVAVIEGLLADPAANFKQIVPVKQQADPSVSTE